MQLGGILLCGGQSTRMGRPKALLPFGDKTLLERIVDRLTPAVNEIVVVGAAGQTLPPLPSICRILSDKVEGQGPLEGLRVGLAALAPTCEAAFAASCDAPFLSPALISRLASQLGDFDAVVPQQGGQLHPLAAIYRTSLAAAAEKLLAQGVRRLQALSLACKTHFCDAETLRDIDPQLQSFCNFNTPEEYNLMMGDKG
jgi:molybdopterin-guanine dinucleotide biosynthesis protein A